ncbi:hypothetical protein VTO73DRAFT_14494 [Trametes versicolor]
MCTELNSLTSPILSGQSLSKPLAAQSVGVLATRIHPSQPLWTTRFPRGLSHELSQAWRLQHRTFHSGGVANYGCTTNETSLSSSSVCDNSSSSNPTQGTVSMLHTAQRAETRNSTHLASMRSVPPPAPAAYDGLAWRALTLRRRRGTLSGKYSDHSLYVAPSNFDGVQPGRVPKYVGQVRSAKACVQRTASSLDYCQAAHRAAWAVPSSLQVAPASFVRARSARLGDLADHDAKESLLRAQRPGALQSQVLEVDLSNLRRRRCDIPPHAVAVTVVDLITSPPASGVGRSAGLIAVDTKLEEVGWWGCELDDLSLKIASALSFLDTTFPMPRPPSRSSLTASSAQITRSHGKHFHATLRHPEPRLLDDASVSYSVINR